MHAARIEKSELLQRVLKLLQKGGEWSTREIQSLANCCAVNTAIDELRENGFNVPCQRKGNLWFYRLEAA